MKPRDIKLNTPYLCTDGEERTVVATLNIMVGKYVMYLCGPASTRPDSVQPSTMPLKQFAAMATYEVT